jgi:signal peptidase I
LKYATKKILRDYIATVMIAVGLAILIRTYGVEAYRIPSQSMKPALLAGDTIFVNKWSQKVEKNILPNRGDIIVFTNIASSSTNPGNVSKGPDYIRRVVGLPGDTLALKNGHLFLNGASLLVREKKSVNSLCFREKLARSTEYVEYQICSEGSFLADFGPEKVPANSVFVIEDSRTTTQQNTVDLQPGSLKRKGWGIIPLTSIKGKASWIWLSIQERGEDQGDKGKFGWLPRFRWDRMFRRI